MSEFKKILGLQLIWEKDDWYSFVSRTPLVSGHIILAYDETLFYDVIPKDFEKYLIENIKICLLWADQYKSPNCYPIFFRANIAREQFRVHIFPLSQSEILESSFLLRKRHPDSIGKGGILNYIGEKENLAEQMGISYEKSLNVEEDLKSNGILMVVNQYRVLCQKE